MGKKNYLKEKSHLENVTTTAWNQIVGGVGIFVAMSWGISKIWAMWRYCRNDIRMPCLVLHVSGLLHTGLVVVAYNEVSDTYEVALFDEKEKILGDWHIDVYCDELGYLIDTLVERPEEMSDDEYDEKSTADTIAKMLTDVL